MDYDIAIIGGGPAGLSFALSLQASGLKIAVIEKQTREELSNPANDGRDIALTHLSRRLMQQHGTWQRVDPKEIAPLIRAEVIDGESPYTLAFDTPDEETGSLGFLISNFLIRKAIFEEFETRDNVTLIDGTFVTQISTDEDAAWMDLDNGQRISATLAIGADTRFSNCRRQMGISADSHDFGRSAILCWMDHELENQHTALECFLYGGTLAILPLNGNRCSAVITVDSSKVDELLTMDEESFNREVEQRVGGRLGSMKQVGERFHYPLVGVHANRFHARRFALIGDAAVGMHPVTAHGFNLGLSGQDLLATEILNAITAGEEYWQPAVLQRYQQQHMINTRLLYHGTNSIVKLFTNEHLPAKLLRKAMLRVSNHLPPVKWAIQQKLMTKDHLSSLIPKF